MTEYDRIQFEQAANGCISGTLEEWPCLHAAFYAKGIDLHQDTRASTLTVLSKLVLSANPESFQPDREPPSEESKERMAM